MFKFGKKKNKEISTLEAVMELQEIEANAVDEVEEAIAGGKVEKERPVYDFGEFDLNNLPYANDLREAYELDLWATTEYRKITPRGRIILEADGTYLLEYSIIRNRYQPYNHSFTRPELNIYSEYRPILGVDWECYVRRDGTSYRFDHLAEAEKVISNLLYIEDESEDHDTFVVLKEYE